MWMHRYQPILGSEALGILSLSKFDLRENTRGEYCEFLGTKDNVLLGLKSIVLKYVAICVYACHDRNENMSGKGMSF